MAHLNYIHHAGEHGSASGQACEDHGYFYLAETDAGITVQEISVDSGFQVDFKEDSRVIEEGEGVRSFKLLNLLKWFKLKWKFS